MVGVINPNTTQTLHQQIDSARSADFQVAPGEPVPAEAGTATTLGTAATGSSSSSSSSSPSSSAAASEHNLAASTIAGIVVGVVAFVGMCAALFYFVGRARSLKQHLRRSEDATAGLAAMPPGAGGHVAMSQYGSGGLGSPGLASSGYGSPGQSEYGFGAALPGYGQRGSGGEQYSGRWRSSSPMLQQQQQGHMSMRSDVSGLSLQQ